MSEKAATRIPSDIRAIVAAPTIAALWNALTPVGRRDFVTWVESAKQEETRSRRVASIPSRLRSGKKRPCCYAVVPMDLYSALNMSAKAKTTWKTLTPDEKRDFVAYVGAGADRDAKRARVEKVIDMLRSGKRRP